MAHVLARSPQSSAPSPHEERGRAQRGQPARSCASVAGCRRTDVRGRRGLAVTPRSAQTETDARQIAAKDARGKAALARVTCRAAGAGNGEDPRGMASSIALDGPLAVAVRP